MKKNLLFIAEIVFMACIVLGTVVYNTVLQTTVPFAPVSYKSDKDSCAPFVDSGLNCKVVFDTSEITPQNELIFQKPFTGETVRTGTDVVLTYSLGPAEWKVPNLNGKTVEDAKSLLHGRNIKISEVKVVNSTVFPEGLIVGSNPKEGENVPNGGSFTLEVSSGKSEIPDVAGKNFEEAQSILEKLGFKVAKIEEESDKQVNTVLRQSDVGLKPLGTEVQLIVAKKKEPVTIKIPDVTGKTLQEAEVLLAEAGFSNLKTVNPSDNAKVENTSPAAGKDAKEDDIITITMTPPPSPQPSASASPQPSPAPTPQPSPSSQSSS